jgi:sugar lactone lactonase YvrE
MWDNVEVVGEAAVVGGPNGLFVGGPEALLYQASVSARCIFVIDPDTGQVLDRIGPERGVHGPDDVYVTSNGTIYWTDFFVGRVGRLAVDGTWRVQAGIPGPNPITMRDGRLFVATTLFGAGLYELDPELIESPRVLLADLVNPNAYAFGPDRLLYVPMMFDACVVSIDVDADPVRVVATVADGLRMPTSVKFDQQGRMVVTEYAGGRTIRIDLESGSREVLLDIDGILDNSAIGPDGTVYSAAQADGTIWAIDPSGETRVLTPGGFVAPGGLAVDADGSLLVADWFSLRRYRSGVLESSFYNRVESGMASANTVSFAGNDLLVTGAMRGTLQVLDAATGSVRQDVRDLAMPTNAIVHGGEIVVAQAGTRDGRGPGDVIRLADRGALVTELQLPTGLASDGATLYVADWATGCVWFVSPTGRALLAAGLSHPEGVALTGTGSLLVVEEGIGQVTSIDLASGDRTAVATIALGREHSPGMLPPYGVMAGITVAPDGSFWVASDVDRLVYRFGRRR